MSVVSVHRASFPPLPCPALALCFGWLAGAAGVGGDAGGVDVGADVGAVGVGDGAGRCCGQLPGGGRGSQLVDEARKQERLLWYTSLHPNTPLHSSLPLNTAVALPVSLSAFRRDLCFVFFAEHDVNVRRKERKERGR